ncbi:unnamed protein product [Linum trigynum]|uniref:Secreted protein n=1 Tax=Linum trigynum TaxID=586398 RepID=A0AAV2D8Q5_9ROSI
MIRLLLCALLVQSEFHPRRSKGISSTDVIVDPTATSGSVSTPRLLLLHERPSAAQRRRHVDEAEALQLMTNRHCTRSSPKPAMERG